MFFPYSISLKLLGKHFFHVPEVMLLLIFGALQISTLLSLLIFDTVLHANILIYDYKLMTIERFEPYGNTASIDGLIDDVLEEELTWSTGLKYLRPNSYLPGAGFQSISDEQNIMHQKRGDFGGFCLAWCLWYLETKLKNPDIESKTLVEKLINKLNKLDIFFIEYIRNYSNKINKKRIEYMKQSGISDKNISNIILSFTSSL